MRLILRTPHGDRVPVPVLDGTVLDYVEPIQEYLRTTCSERHARLLARPSRRREGIDWLTDLPGTVCRLDELDAAAQQAGAATTAALLRDIAAAAARLRAQPRAQDTMARLLDAAIAGVTPGDIHFVGDQPVLAGWGLRAARLGAVEASANHELLGELDRLAQPPAEPPPATPAQPPVAPVAPLPKPPPVASLRMPPPAVAPPTAPVAAIRGPAPSARLVVPVLLALLLLAAAAWLLPGPLAAAVAALRPPPLACPAPPQGAPGLAAAREQETALRTRLLQLEQMIGARVLQCRLPPVPAAAAPRPATAPPAAAIDQRLIRNNARQGRAQVTLAWNGRADLDLYVRCPNGEVISFGKRQGGGGELDVDMNFGTQHSDEPVEHVTWAQDPPAGTYTVLVTYPDARQAGTGTVPPVPFTVRIDIGETSHTEQGTAREYGPLRVTSFHVP
ncbi:conserved protein of unknown function [Rhodovastum atsumiense]|uniref:hypothetical protein n=1 Tax=Rhodovastum atsumiense TaxID=504468 RepID=UPI00139F2B6C|nr:hypothetical protein [Rhodovastum atsumiense]CAH2603543.1 conserved protein of unknown function [Rhodovastum atsumiense]